MPLKTGIPVLQGGEDVNELKKQQQPGSRRTNGVAFTRTTEGLEKWKY